MIKGGLNNVQKTVLSEPVVAHFTAMYSTLMSIVQGVALGALVVVNIELLQSENLTWRGLFRVGAAFIVICIIWHSYITHNQYLAWRPREFDTLIPMGFSVIQTILVFSIKKEATHLFFIMTVVALWGAVAYLNTILRHRGEHVLPLYRERFNSESAGNAIYAAMAAFQWKAFIFMLASAAAFFLGWYFCRSGSLVEPYASLVLLSIVVAISLTMFRRDVVSALLKAVP